MPSAKPINYRVSFHSSLLKRTWKKIQNKDFTGVISSDDPFMSLWGKFPTGDKYVHRSVYRWETPLCPRFSVIRPTFSYSVICQNISLHRHFGGDRFNGHPLFYRYLSIRKSLDQATLPGLFCFLSLSPVRRQRLHMAVHPG